MSSASSTDSSVTSAGDLYDASRCAVGPDKEATLAWRNLTVQVDRKLPRTSFWGRTKTESHTILNNVNGYIKSGVLTAIMGSSGAGKTTLLATISQRCRMNVSGHILVNGKNASKEMVTSISGFVPQQDLVFKTLTVMEHMEFMANLMMDQRAKRIHRNRRIYCLLTELGLLRCSKTQLASLSGGEMKRLSLAVQLLTDPPFLFCDEPTTGLDSYSAGNVLENLRRCAERGKAIICTIHQPASGHFELFHEVYLLAGGRVAYSGPVKEAIAYFNGVGMVCPQSYNPAEFYVQQLAIFPGKEDESHIRNSWLCNQFSHSESGQKLEKIVNDEYLKSNESPSQNYGISKGNWSTCSGSTTTTSFSENDLQNRQFNPYLQIIKPSCFTQLQWLTSRAFKDVTRNSADIILRFILFMFVAVIISTPYIGVAVNPNQSSIQNTQGFIYLIITETVFTFSYSMLHTFPAEIPILLREVSNGLYKPAPYYISKVVIVFPKAIVESTLYALCIFWIAGLEGDFMIYVEFITPIAMSSLSATAYGMLMSAAFDSVATASLVSVPLEFLQITFSGMYMNLRTVPYYLAWLKYVSQFYYGQEAVSITHWNTVSNIECPSNPNLPCIPDGQGVLHSYGYDRSHYGLDLMGLASIYCVAHILGFICLWRRSKGQSAY